MDSKRVVAVLGGCGFIGSALVRRLVGTPELHVVVVDNLSGGFAHLLPDDPCVELVIADARDLNLSDVGSPSTVFYLCGQPFVPDSYANPEKTHDTNVRALSEFLAKNQAMTSPWKLVYASSGEVYGDTPEGCADESWPLTTLPANPYVESRVVAERTLFSYELPSVALTVLRLFNVVGPGATHPYLVPEMIRQIEHGRLVSHGDLSAIRDFVWLGDTVDAFVAAAHRHGSETAVFNVSTGRGWAAGDVVDRLVRITAARDVQLAYDQRRDMPHRPHRLVGCAQKIERELQWRATTSLDTALRRTVEMYRRSGAWPFEAATSHR